MKRILSFIVFLLSLTLFGSSLNTDINLDVLPSKASEADVNSNDSIDDLDEAKLTVAEDGSYTSQEDVALYIHMYGTLPNNYITKEEAYSLGWDKDSNNLWDIADHKSIGGDRFYNREGLLPNASGRYFYECDINYTGTRRGAERIVFSNDGLVYYTADHYESFTLLYGNES